MKRPWTPDEMAERVANALPDGSYVNLGIGMPTAVAAHVPPGREIIYHSENGILGMGPPPAPGDEDPNLVNAGKQPITLIPGASIFHHADSFAMIRGGHIDIAVLGGMQVSAQGDLANWIVGGQKLGSIGGAMDLAVGAKRVFVMMRHVDKSGDLKIVDRCTYPLTGERCVSMIFTDLAVIDVTTEGLVARELAPGHSLEDVQRVTGPRLRMAVAVG
ncbi:MAG: 3-oxoacid CoA-transferase subunit B [Chloroflexota bacterium]